MKITARMEKWIETRLWNQISGNATITVRQIVSELTQLFHLELTAGSQRQVESKIEQIRFRVYKRRERWLHRRAEWARQVGVPERLIQRWFRAGWIDPGKPQAFKVLAGMIFERDYYFRFIEPAAGETAIPEDPAVCISKL
ncbi:MAG: hypothetical protein ACOZF0_20965 [Thermodesulfobacteriota bacterium]